MKIENDTITFDKSDTDFFSAEFKEAFLAAEPSVPLEQFLSDTANKLLAGVVTNLVRQRLNTFSESLADKTTAEKFNLLKALPQADAAVATEAMVAVDAIR